MKLVIDISNPMYDKIKNLVDMGMSTDIDEVVVSGTPIHDDSTNGDVIRTMFPDEDIEERYSGIVIMNHDTAARFDIDWWNASYNKTGGSVTTSD